jgi:antitoxin VapB
MAFNIKDDETHALAKEVAEMSGESMSKAVDTALRERRDRLTANDRRARIQHIIELGRKHRDKDFVAGADHGDLLYDENGLPW